MNPRPLRRTLLVLVSALVLLTTTFSTATVRAAESYTATIKSSVPAGTASNPLPGARAAAMTFSGVVLYAGDRVSITVTGTARGAARLPDRDANGAPAGSQAFAGPVSDGHFARIVGPAANAFSVIATIFD